MNIINWVLNLKCYVSELKHCRRKLEWYRTRYLQKHGYNIKYGNYDLRSLDGGRNWYAVECDNDKGTVIVIDEAEEVYPGILSTLEGLQNLILYVRQNGSITFGDQVNEEVELLKKAGFTVKSAESKALPYKQ